MSSYLRQTTSAAHHNGLKWTTVRLIYPSMHLISWDGKGKYAPDQKVGEVSF